MWLSTKNYMVWHMATAKEFFGTGYVKPVEGIIIPSPDVLFEGHKVGSRVALSFYTDYLPALQLDLLFDAPNKMMHIKVGVKAICNNQVFPKLEAVTGAATMCMFCQYMLWKARNK